MKSCEKQILSLSVQIIEQNHRVSTLLGILVYRTVSIEQCGHVSLHTHTHTHTYSSLLGTKLLHYRQRKKNWKVRSRITPCTSHITYPWTSLMSPRSSYPCSHSLTRACRQAQVEATALGQCCLCSRLLKGMQRLGKKAVTQGSLSVLFMMSDILSGVECQTGWYIFLTASYALSGLRVNVFLLYLSWLWSQK